MARESDHWNRAAGQDMKLDEFDERAAEYALFQRTDLLPQRRSGFVFRVAERLRLRRSWDSFVRSHAARHTSEILQDYGEEMQVEFERRVKFMPTRARSVLDIGCGLAGLDLHIYNYLRDNDPSVYLLDRTRVEDRVWYMFKANGAFYNSLELAKLNLVRNGVPADRVHCLEAPDDGKLDDLVPSVDLVTSTISWGFHYPIGVYLASVARVMSNGGVLLVDIRKGTDGLQELERQFPGATEVVAEGEKHLVVKGVKG
jgi:SAM-dependent methyltransferase